jgi:hypothetical protein
MNQKHKFKTLQLQNHPPLIQITLQQSRLQFLQSRQLRDLEIIHLPRVCHVRRGHLQLVPEIIRLARLVRDHQDLRNVAIADHWLVHDLAQLDLDLLQDLSDQIKVVQKIVAQDQCKVVAHPQLHLIKINQANNDQARNDRVAQVDLVRVQARAEHLEKVAARKRVTRARKRFAKR